ncbi:hypothetical protein JD969_07500 [Planctomycetota bacterium]|nr:hypothetical protein JD969_07500 [Planctomycetota bacterium]
MMKYVYGMIEEFGMDGLFWAWCLMFALPCVVMGGRLLLWSVLGRKGTGKVSCSKCGERVDGKGGEVVECVGCGADLTKRRGIVWERQYWWRAAVAGMVVMGLPLLTWFGFMCVYVVGVVNGDILMKRDLSLMSVREMVEELEEPGQAFDVAVWRELEERLDEGEVSEEMIKRAVDAMLKEKRSENKRYEVHHAMWEMARRGAMSDEVVLKLVKDALDEDIQLEVRKWGRSWLGVDVYLGENHQDLLVSKRNGWVEEMRLDGQLVKFEYVEEKNRGVIIRGKVLLPEGVRFDDEEEHVLSAKVVMVDLGILDGAGVDGRTRREDLPKRVLEVRELELKKAF